MSLHEQIKSVQIKDWLAGIRSPFQSGTPEATRRLQYVRAAGLLLILLLVSYGIVVVFFDKESTQGFEESKQPEPLAIETGVSKVNLEEVRYNNLEEATKKLSADLRSLKEAFQEKVQDKEEETTPYLQSLEDRLNQLETQLAERGHEGFESQISSSSEERRDDVAPEGIIQKHTIILTEPPHSKDVKTIETTIPAGAFAKTILLSGLDASASMNASADPRPMLLRLVDHGTLPRRFQSDLKDCHCTAGAYGDLSSERIYARLEKLSCIDRKTGEIIETQVSGYIAGSDGKAGIRGVVASKDGKFLSRSLMGGFFAGLSNVTNPQNRQAQVNPFYQGTPNGAQISPPGVGDMFASGMAQGATTALDRLSQYYIDRAEQLQPVIQVDAGQVVDVVFTEQCSVSSAQNSVQCSVSSAQNSVQCSVSSVQK